MDPVSRNLDSEDMDINSPEDAVADMKTQLGDLQIGGGGEMLIDEYDAVDEKPDVAIITPDDSAEESEPLADDFEAMRARTQVPIPDLEIAHEAVHTWHIENYRGLSNRERGPKFDCGGHPWRVLLFPRGNNVDHASMYLEQGHEDGDEKAPEGWYACVQFTLLMWNRNDPSIYISHSANHRFNAEEADWGFTRFAEIRKMFAPSWEGKGRPMVENDAVNISTYIRIYKDPTGVLWHNFINYNSKKETGMSLYFTNAFRKAIYAIPTENEADRRNSAWALQRLFYLLQTNEDAVSTQELTGSFGWETKHIFEQQDVQELSRILMERMEERMKGTEAENALPRMFVGKMKTYISCINVDYESSRIEDFWDIQLNVSGNRCLDDSFRDYIQVETMDGENKYFAEGHGLQDARKGVIFESFPQVLHLQLKRFEYDINRDAMTKVNDRYEFPEIWDASPYLSESADKSEPYTYQLHGVLVHSGDFNAGHYYAFLKPTADGYFYRFDDDRVTRATMKEALEENFGGDYANISDGNTGVRNPYTRKLSTKRSMSAYMLVYIRQSRLAQILQDVSDADSPPHLAKQLNEERAAIERRRKEREEQHLYLHVGVIDEDSFKAYQGFDLTDWNLPATAPGAPKPYRTLRSSTVADFIKLLAEERMMPPEQYRLWIMVNRQNKTIRPDQPIFDVDETIETVYNKSGSRDRPFRLWLERAAEMQDGKPKWPEYGTSSTAQILIFLKYFDVDNQSLMGVGPIYMSKHSKVSDMVPHLSSRMGWSNQNSKSSSSPSGKQSLPITNGVASSSENVPPISLYEEIKHSMIEPMKPKCTLQQAEIQDGDIICFQRALSESEAGPITASALCPDARHFYDLLLNRLTIKFSPKTVNDPNNEIFDLVLSKKTTYDQLAARVAEQLRVEPSHVRFSTVIATTGKPKQPLRRMVNANLWQILNPYPNSYNNSGQRSDMLIYEILEMSVTELESKKVLKVTFLTEGITKEDTYDILVPKNGTIADLLRGLQRKGNMSDALIEHVRIFEVQGCRIQREFVPEDSVALLMETITLYAEVCPEEETEAGDQDRAIYAFHFDKEVMRPHGIPFKFVLKPAHTKERISKRTHIKGKQFDKIKFNVVGRGKFGIPEELQD
ncbi:MAG: hypothetical protein Q9191_006654, partial [Dirinaria sp. TL-2023a]